MSSLIQHNGRYYVQWMESGKKHEKPLVPPNSHWATRNKETATRLKRKFDKTINQVDDPVTLPELLPMFYHELELTGGSKNNQDRNRKNLEAYIKAQGVTDIEDITRTSIMEWISDMTLSHKTRRNKASSVTLFCRWLAERELISGIPTIRISKGKKLPPRFMTDDQRETALHIARGNDCFLEVLIPLYTGVRLGELRRMKWEDFDFQRKLLHIPECKNGKPRSIPLSSYLIDELWPLSGLVFPAKREGSGMREPHTFIARIKPVIEAMPEVFRDGMATKSVGRAYHLFRHDFAVRAAKAGVPIPELMNWLGHQSITTTMIYAQFSPDSYSSHIEKI